MRELLVNEERFDKACASGFARDALVSALHGVLPSVVAEWVRHAIGEPDLASLGEEGTIERDLVQRLEGGGHAWRNGDELDVVLGGELADRDGEVAGVSMMRAQGRSCV